ncbi:hypothetical protein [Pandoravirus japonicus]|uniref:Uncharacterized protein n=1 Tax=Pandoravirus japonicus TaxID=2823154 RepID=A0A811BNY5_9VIRU|nr:hypothetical protein [Pandoravirus japonicus]
MKKHTPPTENRALHWSTRTGPKRDGTKRGEMSTGTRSAIRQGRRRWKKNIFYPLFGLGRHSLPSSSVARVFFLRRHHPTPKDG